MPDHLILAAYKEKLNALEKIVKDSNKRAIADDPDSFITDNINFFTKSFIITACAYLESFLKEISLMWVKKVNDQLKNVVVPHNLVLWSLLKEEMGDEKDRRWNYKNLEIDIQKKHLDKYISGNPGKTIDSFRRIGLDLLEEGELFIQEGIIPEEEFTFQNFNDLKNMIGTIVGKRNNIIHHNDDDTASSVSLEDILGYITFFKQYMMIIAEVVVRRI